MDSHKSSRKFYGWVNHHSPTIWELKIGHLTINYSYIQISIKIYIVKPLNTRNVRYIYDIHAFKYRIDTDLCL